MSEQQEFLDRFYWQNGPCCAGCDWWRSFTSTAGECTKSAPVKPDERYAMMGFQNSSYPLSGGHVFTPRDHHCGDFKDDFDWNSLPPHYLRKIEKL